MEDKLPDEVDLIVVGTGITESIIAAAASRIGKTVLHVDNNDFYGGNWASFNLDNLQSFATKVGDAVNPEATSVDADAILLGNPLRLVSNIEQEWYVGEDVEKVDGRWTKEELLKSRKFNIDLCTKMLFSGGDLVELLISSNICRYAEFRAVDKILSIVNGKLTVVPCSRSDVFTTKDVNVVEKRLLMKVLTNCLNSAADGDDEFKDYETSTFRKYLEDKRLTPNLIHYILYAISMSTDETLCTEGVSSTKKFLTSLGRYGNTPFVFPMYGCGEIPQCFCRLCAVYGGLYCLKRPIDRIYVNGGSFDSVQCREQRIKSKNIVIGNGVMTEALMTKVASENSGEKETCGNISRAIIVSAVPLGDDSINAGGGGVLLLRMLPLSGKTHDGVVVTQLSHWSATCPKGLYLIHLTCETISNAKEDLEPYVNELFEKHIKQVDATESPEGEVSSEEASKERQTILYSLYFNIPVCPQCKDPHKTAPNGVHLSCGPFYELDYDLSIKKAKEIFTKIYPDDEFLPRAPDPEEIIIETDDSVAKPLDESIKEQLADVAESIENVEKCMEENNLNEDKEQEHD